VPRPSTAAAYRHLARLTKGTNAVTGSAKGRRSIADRPKGVYGRLRAVRPGEYVILDTQDLDVFAMEPVTCRWVRAQLTVAQDLFTQCITGLRVTPVSTKAVDVAGVLYQAVAARPAPQDWPAEACWAYHGVPQHLVFTEDGRLPGIPVCPPETLVIDHGKAFLSAHVISVCTRLGISIQPAQPKKPTDKPTCERFFKTLREGLIQYLPAYKGPDIYSRGEGLEDAAFLFIHELEDVIREWVARHFTDRCIVSTCPDLRLLIDYMSATESAGMLPHLFGVSQKYAAHLIMDWGPRESAVGLKRLAASVYSLDAGANGSLFVGLPALSRSRARWYQLALIAAPEAGMHAVEQPIV